VLPVVLLYCATLCVDLPLGSSVLFCTWFGSLRGGAQWVRQFADGRAEYIEGAASPEYVVTVDDCDAVVAIECVPMNDQGQRVECLEQYLDGTCVSETVGAACSVCESLPISTRYCAVYLGQGQLHHTLANHSKSFLMTCSTVLVCVCGAGGAGCG